MNDLCTTMVFSGMFVPVFNFFFKFVECLELKPVLVYNQTTNKTEPTFDIIGILIEQNKTLAFDR